jgi:acetyl esterase/lipase
MNAIDASALHPPAVEIRLWEGRAPLSVSNAPPEQIESGNDTNRHISRVEVPTLIIDSPPKDENSGIAAVICPGGGYRFLSWDKGSIAVAEWLQAHDVTGAVLKYRLPAPNKVEMGHLRPLLDAQCALRLLRERAPELGIKTNCVGITGFSAGGHLAATVATKFTDAATRPDFAGLASRSSQ